ncbi:MAG: PIG-L deacetylase family protein [Acidobacteriota bacterium]|jgi:LmbE family N-acetylglucosaminyl deacetylase
MKILAVFAHPDDETFGPGGTLSRYSLTGHTVRLATLTHGEAGSLGPAKHLTMRELGRLRAEELRCAAKELHLSGLNLYHLPDGKLAELPAEHGLTIIRQEINTFLPDALITFHAAGISGHPDHQTAARWCLQAVQEQTNPPRMYAYGISSEQARRISHRKLTPIPDDEITHVIDVSQYLDYKFSAIRCHQSQSEAWEKIQAVEGGLASHLRYEHFSQVWPIPEQKRRMDRLED